MLLGCTPFIANNRRHKLSLMRGGDGRLVTIEQYTSISPEAFHILSACLSFKDQDRFSDIKHIMDFPWFSRGG